MRQYNNCNPERPRRDWRRHETDSQNGIFIRFGAVSGLDSAQCPSGFIEVLARCPAADSHAPAADSHAAPAADSHAPADSGHQVAAKDASHGSAKKSAKKKSGHGATWSYSGKAGPSNWGRLSKDYHACLQGASQSPIDIGGTGFDGASVEPIQFDYSLSPVEFINNGHTVQVNYAPGSSMTVAGKRYELL